MDCLIGIYIRISGLIILVNEIIVKIMIIIEKYRFDDFFSDFGDGEEKMMISMDD